MDTNFVDAGLKRQWCIDLLDRLNQSKLFAQAAILAEFRADINIPNAPVTEIGFYPMLISQKPTDGAETVEAMVIDTRTYLQFFEQIATPTFTYNMSLEAASAAIMNMVDNWAHFRNLNMQYGTEIGYQPPKSEKDSHSGLILT